MSFQQHHQLDSRRFLFLFLSTNVVLTESEIHGQCMVEGWPLAGSAVDGGIPKAGGGCPGPEGWGGSRPGGIT